MVLLSLVRPTNMSCQNPGALEPTLPLLLLRISIVNISLSRNHLLRGPPLISSWVFDYERCWLCYI